MSFDDFKLAYQPLANKWPMQFAKVEVREAMYQEMKNFEIPWVKALVGRILVANDPNFKIQVEVDKERRLRGFDRQNSDNAEEYERMRLNSTDHGFNAILRQYHAHSLWEAVENSKKGRQ